MKQNLKPNIWVSLVLLMAAIATIAILGTGLTQNQKIIPSTLIDKPARDVKGPIIQDGGLGVDVGRVVGMGELREQYKIVVLNFWASWCVSCRQEAAELEAFWQENKLTRDVLVLGVAIQDSLDAAKAFAQYYGKTYPLILDDTGRAAVDYGVTGVPESFLIDQNGVVVKKHTGPVSAAELKQWVAPYLN